MVTRLAQAAGEDAGACGSRVGARRLDPGPAAAPGHRHGRAHAATGRCADHSRTAGFKALQTPGRKEAQARCSKLIEHRTACNRASNIYHGARRTALVHGPLHADAPRTAPRTGQNRDIENAPARPPTRQSPHQEARRSRSAIAATHRNHRMRTAQTSVRCVAADTIRAHARSPRRSPAQARSPRRRRASCKFIRKSIAGTDLTIKLASSRRLTRYASVRSYRTRM